MSCDYVRRKPKPRNVVVDAVNDAIGKTIETASAVVGSGLGSLLSGWASSFRRKAAKAEPVESPKPASTPRPEVAEEIELEERSEFLFLKIAEASTSSHVSAAMNKQIERATKKFAPKSTDIRVIWNSLAEHEALESSSDGQTSSVFSQLISFPSQGRVFIGFPTHQTTGCCAHLAAALIPTVERESIDFVDPALATWNKGDSGGLCHPLPRPIRLRSGSIGAEPAHSGKPGLPQPGSALECPCPAVLHSRTAPRPARMSVGCSARSSLPAASSRCS
ncbi:hypothetical protein DL89DRAFT_27719 [Linderina pennispora]|uniref:Uncharacterized protein n=1 Tax=Linderina pennispora TaxID=61395 RepID=A0A1Y1W3Z1_9FUNG|nr:uncharacterized protein DL89DRAFT_27719 [Linderina pennispora]ORX68177.1 hypothetical protein DL89DRAFT_27719 [Linderina pennispora]